MISTAGLELTNLLNPDLTWKTVTKGNRSSTRRTRKPSVRNLTGCVESADNNGHKKAEDTTVSESEKLGVAVLGRRFNGDIEHVPIKKRKFNFRSSSPPQPQTSSPPQPQTSSHADVVEHASSQRACPNLNGKRLLTASSEPNISHGVVDGKSSDSVKENLSYKEDFSGIEILAAAACGSSLDGDVDHPEEKLAVEGFIQENDSALFVEEAVASLDTANCRSRDADITEDTSVLDTADFLHNSSSEKDQKTIERSLPSRLHWDLNVVMDAWEEPSNSVSIDSQTKDVEGTVDSGLEEQHILEDCETERETMNVKQDNMADVVSSEVQDRIHISSDLRGLADESNQEENQLKACSGLDCNLDECVADLKDSSLPSYLEEEKECCASNVKEDEIVQVENFNVASPHIPAADGISCESERKTLNANDEDSGRASCSQNDVNAHQVMINMDNCELPDPVEVDPASKPEEVGVDHSSPRCADVALSSESAKDAGAVVTEGAKGETDSSLYIDSVKLSPMSSGIVTATLETGYANEGNGGNAPSNSSCKISFEESCDDICLSDTSHDSKVPMVHMENTKELQDGYDSQFEDGELRETDAHFWEENNDEGADIEQVDYESECEGERVCIYESEDIDNKRKFESGSSLGSGEVTEKSEQGAVGDSLLNSEARISEAALGNKTKKISADCEDESNGKGFTSTMVGARASRSEFLSHGQGSLSSDVLQRCGSDNFDDLCPRSEKESDPNSRLMGRDRFSLHMHHRSSGGNHIVDTMWLESKGKGFPSTMVGARAPRREFPSYGQGSLSSDVLQRCGSDNFDDLCPRSEKESDPNSRLIGRDRFSLHMHHRSSGGNHIVNTRQSPPYHGPYSSGRLRPRSVVESRGFVMTSDRTMLETTGVEGFDSRVRRQYMSSSSNSVYQPFNRRLLGYRDVYTGTAPVRDIINPDRSRFRRYPPGVSRGFREDYHRPMPNYPTDDYMPQRMGRRERSVSPLGESRHYVQPYKKPGSRSRSRSPSAWFSMRERIEASRRRSRSPDFRSARINRARAPFKKRFEVECEEGFMSPPRNRISPQHNFPRRFEVECEEGFMSPPRNRISPQRNLPRFDEGFMSPPRNRISPQRNLPRFDDRISGLDNLRDRKSPVRMFRQGQRFDSSRSFRSVMPPRRFPDMGGAGAGRGYKYEGGEHDDRRKPGNRYEVVHRVRHYDNDGDGTRRLRYNNNSPDSFGANES